VHMVASTRSPAAGSAGGGAGASATTAGAVPGAAAPQANAPPAGFAEIFGSLGSGGTPTGTPGSGSADAMGNLMNSPIMQNMLNNPETMRNLMSSNPALNELMERNPQIRHVLDDPELMRRTMQMMRDPSSMQNMMRQNDLAMSQIENLPGGFNALRRMYEDVQEPLMDVRNIPCVMAIFEQTNQNSDTLTCLFKIHIQKILKI